MLSASFRIRLFVFFFNDTATTEIYTLSLHDALPISGTFVCNHVFFALMHWLAQGKAAPGARGGFIHVPALPEQARSEEHTSELQSRPHLVCRLLLEKKKECGARPYRVSRSRRNGLRV